MKKRRYRRKPRTFNNVVQAGGGFVVRNQVEGRCAFFMGSDQLWVRQASNATPFSSREDAQVHIPVENNNRR